MPRLVAARRQLVTSSCRLASLSTLLTFLEGLGHVPVMLVLARVGTLLWAMKF